MILILLCLGNLNLSPDWQCNLSQYDVYRSRALAAADDGTVAAIDRDGADVILIDDRGKLKARIDKNGQGPGELQAPVEICWFPSEKAFAIMDFGNSRISMWDTSGKLVKEYPVTGAALFSPLFPDPQTVFFARDMGGLNGTPTLVSYHIPSKQTAPLWSYKPSKMELSSGINDGNSFRILFRWNPRLVYGLGQDFIAITFGEEKKFFLLDHKGQPSGSPINVSLPRYPVTDEQLEEGVQLMPLNLHKSLRSGLVKPEGWPYIRAIHVDPADRIWVIGSSPDVGKAHPLQVFDRKGTVLGQGKIAKVPLAITASALYYLNGDHEEDLLIEKVAYRL